MQSYVLILALLLAVVLSYSDDTLPSMTMFGFQDPSTISPSSLTSEEEAHHYGSTQDFQSSHDWWDDDFDDDDDDWNSDSHDDYCGDSDCCDDCQDCCCDEEDHCDHEDWDEEHDDDDNFNDLQDWYGYYDYWNRFQPTPPQQTTPPASTTPIPAADDCSDPTKPPVLRMQTETLPQGLLHDKALLHIGVCHVKSRAPGATACSVNGILTTCDDEGIIQPENTLDFEFCPQVQAIALHMVNGTEIVGGGWDSHDKPIGAVQTNLAQGVFGLSARECEGIKRFSFVGTNVMIDRIEVWKQCDFYCTTN
ncbi:hypothetical protein RCL1_008924 [Eukaryota sp. TZLM3-RCL]